VHKDNNSGIWLKMHLIYILAHNISSFVERCSIIVTRQKLAVQKSTYFYFGILGLREIYFSLSFSFVSGQFLML